MSNRFERQLDAEVERVIAQGHTQTDEELSASLERLLKALQGKPKPPKPDTALNRNAKARLARLEQQGR